MKRFVALFAIASSLVFSRAGRCDSPTTAPAVSPEVSAKVAKILKDMASPDYATREKASKDANGLPLEAIPLLEKASTDEATVPEVVERLGPILKARRPELLVLKIVQRDKDFHTWTRALRWSDYQHAGHSNPKWDSAVGDAYDLRLKLDIDPTAAPDVNKALMAAFNHAIELGCDDPFVRYSYLVAMFHVDSVPPEKIMEAATPAVLAIEAGNYSGYFKFLVQSAQIQRCLDCRRSGLLEDPKVLPAEVKKLEGFYPDAVKTPGLDLDKTLQIASSLLKAELIEDSNRFISFDNLVALMKKAGRPDVEISCITADFLAWAEQHEHENGVGKQPHQAQDIIAVATQLQRASDADPSDYKLAEKVLQVCLLRKSGREEMEKWYHRTIDDNPIDSFAYVLKQRYLLITAQEAAYLDFTHQCAHTKYADQKIGIDVGVEGIAMMAGWRGDGVNNRFLEKHPEAWDDIQFAFENYLKAVPNDLYNRSRYANFAVRLEHWKIAGDQLKILGENAVPDVFGSKAELEYLKRKIAAHLPGAAK